MFSLFTLFDRSVSIWDENALYWIIESNVGSLQGNIKNFYDNSHGELLGESIGIPFYPILLAHPLALSEDKLCFN